MTVQRKRTKNRRPKTKDISKKLWKDRSEPLQIDKWTYRKEKRRDNTSK